MPSLSLAILLYCAGAYAQAPGAPKTVYVEPFTTRTLSTELRDAVIAELRKSKVVVVPASAASAGLILGGGGEVWVSGYRSLNPRAGTSPANGRALYGGYLAVELRDAAGDTLWSDLVTPERTSEDVSRDLAKKIARHVEEVLPRLAPRAGEPSVAPRETQLRGAGATFPFPVYDKWFKKYHRENPAVTLSYSAVGSEAGVRSLLSGEVDFAASDSPVALRELAPSQESNYLMFPSVAGAVVPILNLPGTSGDLQLTPQILAGIYSGKIKKWNDPAIRQWNRGVHLPDLDIQVVHRSDGSGTSYAFTDFLAQTNPDWNAHIGVALRPRWPVGRGAAGNEGVAAMVKELGGAIGYVEFIYALRNHLNYAKVQNRDGEFVAASLESIAAAVSHSPHWTPDGKNSLVNAPGHGSYPLASFTWLVTPLHFNDERKSEAMAAFLKWMLGPGQRQAAAVGYLELPKEIITRELTEIGRLR